jgi:hypothetical protein
MADKRKATAKRFGVKKGAPAKDLKPSKGGEVKGGAVRPAPAAHGCPACPHPAGR